MRSTFMYLFYKSPFENLKRHADKVNECAKVFQEAVGSYLDKDRTRFDELTDQVAKLESEADAIKRNIRGHMPKGVLMPVDKFQFFMYLREQDKVLDAVEDSLYWLSYGPGLTPRLVADDMKYLAAAVATAIEKLSPLVEMSIGYFRSGSKEERKRIKSLIRDIRQDERETDHLEWELMHKIFTEVSDPLEVFYLVRVTETIASVADHAQNASDMMRAMVAE